MTPDQSYNDKYSFLVGTSVLCPMIRDCIKQSGTKFLETLPIQANWAMAYAGCCKLTDSQLKDSKVFCVMLSSKVPVCLKNGELCTLKGMCHTKPGGGGLIVYDQRIDVKPESHSNFKLAVKNVSQHDITLYLTTVTAECFPIDWVMPVLPSDFTIPSDVAL